MLASLALQKWACGRSSGQMRSFVAIVLFMVLLGSTSAPAETQKAVGPEQACLGEGSIAACDQLINSGQLHGPDLIQHLVRRGTLLQGKHQYQRAIADFSSAIAIDPKYSFATYGFRGLAYESIGDLGSAVADYKAALSLAPNFPYYLKKLRSAEKKLSDLAKPRTNPSVIQRTDPSNDTKIAVLPTAPSERRMALVIGNNGYQFALKLELAVPDATTMTTTLKERGFDVMSGYDLKRREMNRLISDFVNRLSADTVAVIYYSGHGVQIHGTNFLLPTDINPEQESDVADDGVELGRVLEQVRATKAHFVLAIIDACRNNPFRAATRSIGGNRGLAPTTVNGAMILYSAGVDQEAVDKLTPTDTNGLFTGELVKMMQVPGLSVQEMMRRIRNEVSRKAESIGRKQTPALYDEASGDFTFTPTATGKNGPGSDADLSAVELFQKGKASYDARNWSEAMRFYRLASTRGNATAMAGISAMYHQGEGVRQDFTESLRWAKMAAEKGDLFAMAMVGVHYAGGEGVAKDCDVAKQWLKKAASGGIDQANEILRSGVNGACRW
jgi:tetratricopeptide (TPR) repeat protein